jgi:hypothetical protein
MTEIGTGTSISFSSGFLAKLLDVSPPNASRESINISHMLTTNAHIFEPAKLVDWGELSGSLAFDPGTKPPMNSVAETITITFPDGETWAFEGFMTAFDPSTPLEDRMTADFTIKVTGDVTVTDAS